MRNSRHVTPADHRACRRLVDCDWRPTRFGRGVNRFVCWWAGLTIRGRVSSRRRSHAVVIATVEGKRYFVSRRGPRADGVQNGVAAPGDAVIRQGRRRRVHLGALPLAPRAPRLRPSVRIAPNALLCTGSIPPHATCHHRPLGGVAAQHLSVHRRRRQVAAHKGGGAGALALVLRAAAHRLWCCVWIILALHTEFYGGGRERVLLLADVTVHLISHDCSFRERRASLPSTGGTCCQWPQALVGFQGLLRQCCPKISPPSAGQ